MIVRFDVHYGPYVGTDEEHEIEVSDNATDDEIESLVNDAFVQIVLDNSYFEIIKD